MSKQHDSYEATRSTFSQSIHNSATKQKDNLILPQSYAVTCSACNLAYFICINQKCQSKNSFTCLQSECKCQYAHSFCKKVNIKTLNKLINSKIINPEGSKHYLKASVQRTMESINKAFDLLIKRIDQSLPCIQLNNSEKLFLKVLQKQQKPDIWTGQKLMELWNDVTKEKKENIESNKNKECEIVAQIKQQIDKFQFRTKQIMRYTCTNIQNMLKIQHSQLSHLIAEQDPSEEISTNALKITFLSPKAQSQPWQNIKLPHQYLFKKSAIITNKELSDRLEHMFPKKIKRAKMIYQASLHNFSISQFFTECGAIPYTIIMCETNQGKIIGGLYTCCSLYRARNQWIKDITNTSFIFSLTNNQKFMLQQKKDAIYSHITKNFIQFGYSGQFLISDKANVNNDCWTNNLNGGNYNFLNYKNSKQSWLKLNGNDTYNFTVKEWQCWRLKFY